MPTEFVFLIISHITRNDFYILGVFCRADLLGPLSGTKEMTPAITIRPGTKDPVPSAPQAEFLPMDEYNKKLVANGHPPDYVNPEPLEKYDLVRGQVNVDSKYCSHPSH